jgi:hypothetical protein
MARNDHWTLHLEELGMLGAGEELARLILACQPPYAICVQGKWGSGKTSLMRYAMAKLGGEPLGTTIKTSREPIQELPDWLDGPWRRIASEADILTRTTFAAQLTDPQQLTAQHEPRIVPIWFNPWQHQDADMPLVALLQELRTQFTFLVQFGRFAGKLAQVSVEAGLTILGDLVDTFAILQGVPKGLGQGGLHAMRISREHQRRDFEELHDAQRLNLMFEQAVQRLLAPEQSAKEDPLFCRDGCGLALRRLVIFIDDLDRCSDQQTVKLLEAIKLYLQTRYCVFVVGMDSAAARRAVSNVLAHKGEEAQEYLEKLFQTTLHVPVPANHQTYVQGLLANAGFQAGKIDVAATAGHIIELIEPNPRKLKNFVSTLAVNWNVTRGATDDFLLFLLVTYLRTNHPAAYRLLSYDPKAVTLLNQALNEGPLPNDASPVLLFFRQTFRHAFEFAFLPGEAPSRLGGEAIVSELIQRLDRHKGDKAFLALWKTYRDKPGDWLEPRLTRIVQLASPAQQGS